MCSCLEMHLWSLLVQHGGHSAAGSFTGRFVTDDLAKISVLLLSTIGTFLGNPSTQGQYLVSRSSPRRVLSLNSPSNSCPDKIAQPVPSLSSTSVSSNLQSTGKLKTFGMMNPRVSDFAGGSIVCKMCRLFSIQELARGPRHSRRSCSWQSW